MEVVAFMTYEQDRDAMAKQWFTKTTYWQMGQDGFEVAFRDGAQWATEYWKQRGVGEFDKNKAINQAKHEDSDGYFGFLSGAEWQHQQNAATIATLEAKVKELEQKLKDKVTLDMLLLAENYQKEIKELEAENKRFREGYQGACLTCESVGELNVELEAKLNQASFFAQASTDDSTK
jgi:hypothetical protein